LKNYLAAVPYFLKAEIYERFEEFFNLELMRNKENTKEIGMIYEFFGDYFIECCVFDLGRG
jgi:hypothetical protein